MNDDALKVTPFFDVDRPETTLGVGPALLKIAAASKIGPLKIVRDYVNLAFGAGKISFKDYIRLRLFDNAFWQGVDRATVVGQRRGFRIQQTINYRTDWWGMIDNKIASCSYLGACGLPTIPILALYCENLKTDAVVLCDEQALKKLLTQETNYPLFGKPLEGTQSLGSIGLQRYLPLQKSLELHDGRVVPVDAFINHVRTHYSTGYLFQKFVLPHAAIRALCGDRLSTVRIITLTNETGPNIFRACWKIPARKNTADNYWRRGNLLAKVDIVQGHVLRVLSGTGFDLVQHERHPDTHVPLIGFRVPHWRRMLETVIEAARLMHHVPLIGWDVAALDEGPIIVEMNARPDFVLPQLADGRGILEQKLTDMMKLQKRKRAEYKKEMIRQFQKL
jgi:Sugar-transfer associated ATP-grasp